MTIGEFDVALQDLLDAADTVDQQAQDIATHSATITAVCMSVAAPGVWSSPAAGSFGDLQTATTNALANLNSLLAEMVSRMRTAYQNYHDAELANFDNYSTKGR